MQRIDLHEGSMKAVHPTLQRPMSNVKTKSDELAPVHTGGFSGEDRRLQN